MSNESKKEYITLLFACYRNSSKKERSRILDEICRNLQIHRKSAIRLFGSISKEKNKKGRKKVYSFEVIRHLKILWESMDYICAKRMVAAIPNWIGHYECTEEVKKKILEMSASTIDRSLKPFRSALRRRRNCGTKSSRLLKTMIPIKPLDWNVPGPGTVEMDTVAHCGDSLSGEFIWSLTLTDIYSGWTENRAIWGKLSLQVLDMVQDIQKSLPFSLFSVSVDNGSEFICHKLFQHFCPPDHPERHIHFTRSRAYKKNDQCHVEQKNWTHVRQFWGYARFDDKKALDPMNTLYRDYYSYLQNFFMPQVKLLRKTRIGARVKREYTKPQTPYQRLLGCPAISDDKKEELKRQYAALNPFCLTKTIREQQRTIAKLQTVIVQEQEAA